MGDAESVCVWWGRGGRQEGAQLCQETSVQPAALVYFALVSKEKKKNPLSFSVPSTCPTGYRSRQFTYVILPI